MPREPDNHALEAVGTVVSMVTSLDTKHPPENAIDGNVKTFWVTTGLYPQELVLTFTGMLLMKKVAIWSMKVTKIALEKGVGDQALDFSELAEQDVDDTEQSLQSTTFSFKEASIIRHLKIIIKSGYGDFASVHKIVVNGERVAPGGLAAAASTLQAASAAARKPRSGSARSRQTSQTPPIAEAPGVDANKASTTKA
ncbi:Heat shock protein beta-11 [Quaeritorhiza haematococci]|nr:Heat shock protein beta-11 [Quaeritorhiza haematococci]